MEVLSPQEIAQATRLLKALVVRAESVEGDPHRLVKPIEKPRVQHRRGQSGDRDKGTIRRR
jgi:hypothetical protein